MKTVHLPGKLTSQFTLLMTLSLPLVSIAANNSWTELPPPPSGKIKPQNLQYRLELVVNKYATGIIAVVNERNGHFWLSAADLQKAGFPASRLTQPQLDVSAMAEVQVKYDSAQQRLLLQVPDSWLPQQDLTIGNAPRRYPGLTSQGALFNYDIYANRTQHNHTQFSVWNELRLFSMAGTLSSTGVFKQHIAGSDNNNTNQGFTRYDTTYTNENYALSWTVGDLISNALSWNSSVRMGGLSLSRDFSIRPDIITYPLPTFAGKAAVPTAVDLFINGYRSSNHQLQPGPFTITDIPYINGSGEAVLVTTDALGRQVSTTLPFYVASTLLKPGLSDGAFSAGALRRDYGIKNFSYGPLAASGSYRYGATDWLTLESHAEAASSLVLGGLGGLVKLGNFGVLNGAYTFSQMRGQRGDQINWGYQYSQSRFNLATQHTLRDRKFGNLALYDQPNNLNDNQPIFSLSRRSSQYSASLSLDQFGSIGLAYLDIDSFNGDKNRLLNFSWSKGLWGNSNLYASASRDYSQNNWSFALVLQIPFNFLDSVTLDTQRNAAGQNIQRVTYNHAMPSDGGFSWNMAYAHQDSQDDYQQASLGWRNNHVQMQAGIYGSSSNYTKWGNVTGSLVLMDGTIQAANKINDGFVLVSTDGYPNITVDYEHQPYGNTGKSGYLLIPSVPAYYPASFRINTLNLPPDIYADTTRQRLSVKRGRGYLLHFPIKIRHAASVILTDQDGKAIPLASVVTRAGKADTYVGWDGLVYLEDLEPNNLLAVRTPEGKHCQVSLQLPANPNQQLKTYGPLTCTLAGNSRSYHE
ncbi:fimbria/pilus outer membrane usher protein [Arsenophonus nasoniae]|uniref:Fimbria/pilus outer membrane usher protein n=1 Tax=Arsenophonus nasoniae TaxID=638 RepID=A0A4P7KYW9_9GAMM|nr:fimbria/pilus outer membrane usher protein [Arsenophonus nasoniae]QBY41592.1 Outer membrane usher protein YehB [Arsenophonus nasoniae]WGM05795.1 fimbria/pilus outer membrane usher protein [Arsenophonus nasoniae]WGM10807.1 fimbria/pilus outer membrane usher protein [Arsenophonus nasoniae]WGM15514.1 fimbria/pilus outer membrane usher protein [Arsenophonus nasoniae]